MQGFQKNSALMILVFLICTFHSLATCALAENMDDEKAARDEVKKPALMATDANYMIWCGTDALVYIVSEPPVEKYMPDYVYWHDLKTGRKVLIGKETEGVHILPMACTKDGKKLIYLNKGSLRWDKWKKHTLLDVYEFDVVRRAHKRIAVSHEISGLGSAILSPDGKKLFLEKKPAGTKQPRTDWEIVWASKDEPKINNALWLPDSSGIISPDWDHKLEKDVSAILILTPERKAYPFTIKPEFHHIAPLFIDRNNRLFFWSMDLDGNKSIVRCEIDISKKEAVCKIVLKEDETVGINDFDVTADGEAIFFADSKSDSCMKTLRLERDGPYCVTEKPEAIGSEKRTGPIIYIKISPDDKRLAFFLGRLNEKKEWFGEDLFVMELE